MAIMVTLALLQNLAEGRHEFPHKGIAYCEKEKDVQIYNFGVVGNPTKYRWCYGEAQEYKSVTKMEWVKI